MSSGHLDRINAAISDLARDVFPRHRGPEVVQRLVVQTRLRDDDDAFNPAVFTDAAEAELGRRDYLEHGKAVALNGKRIDPRGLAWRLEADERVLVAGDGAEMLRVPTELAGIHDL